MGGLTNPGALIGMNPRTFHSMMGGFTTIKNRVLPIVMIHCHKTAFPKIFIMKWACFISVCGGNSFLLQNASKCHSTGIEIKPKFLACGNAKQLWSSIQLCTHSPWMHFLLDSGERVFCCNWAVSVWSMAATFQQFDQMLD